MPEFLELFSEQILLKKERIRDRLIRGRTSPLDQDIKDLLREHWLPIITSPIEAEVIAVDGSRALRPYASGAFLYIVCSLALWRSRRFKLLEVDSFLSKASAHNINTFVDARMEYLEFRAARAALDDGLAGCVLLMDGSLHSRMARLPRDGPAEGMKGFMLEYFKSLYQLLDLCRRKGILVLGISKDSRSSFFRDYLLERLFTEELTSLEGVDPFDLERLNKLLAEAIDSPVTAFAKYRVLKEKYGGKLSRVEEILREAAAARPDHQLVRNYVESAGYTLPMVLALDGKGVKRVEQIKRSPKDYARVHFGEAALESPDPDGFIEEAAKRLRLVPELPAIISFHVLLDPRDTPMRVDVPSWVFGRNDRLCDVVRSQPAPVDVNYIIGVLLAGYAGLKDYNIWLRQADEEVRLSRRTVDTLYISALEKLLGITVIHRRGYRRVRYP